jgi:hypothetical protein
MKDDLDQLLAAFERLLRICHEALSPTATARQKSDARAVITDWLNSRT